MPFELGRRLVMVSVSAGVVLLGGAVLAQQAGEPAAEPEPPPASGDSANHPEEEAIVLHALEIDLSELLADMSAATPVLPTPAAPEEAPPAPPPGPPKDLESIFEDIREKVSREQQASSAAAQYDSGVAHLREGRVDEAIADLQAAARIPLLRFRAAAELGRFYLDGHMRNIPDHWHAHARPEGGFFGHGRRR